MTEASSSPVEVHDSRCCQLGEGPLWHPEREQLFWFDILGCQLLSRTEAGPVSWQFDENVSAAGWIDRDTLLVASETALFTFDLNEGTRIATVCNLEREDSTTRSNDGRADPWGGFWIGTMGKDEQFAKGSIYRWYRGELSWMYSDITVSNAICFSPDRKWAYFTDSEDNRIMRQELEPVDGWPVNDKEVLVDASEEMGVADGMVVDSDGYLWNARWGDCSIARYSPDGALDMKISYPTPQVSCPAFGGAGYRTLFATTAAVDVDDPEGHAGRTYRSEIGAGMAGLPEYRVIL